MYRSLRSQCLALLLVVSALCLAGPAIAGDPPPTAPGEAAAFDTPTPGGISADQEAALRAYLTPILNQSSEGLVPVTDPDGGISMDPQGRLQHVVLARFGEDGTLQVYSFDDLEPAMSFLTFEMPTPDPVHETAVE